MFEHLNQPVLKTSRLSIGALENAYVFVNGGSWRVISLEEGVIHLEECKISDFPLIMRHPGMIALLNGEPASE